MIWLIKPRITPATTPEKRVTARKDVVFNYYFLEFKWVVFSCLSV